MGTSIRLKKSAVSTNAPGTGDIDYGELAINYNDGKLYYKTSSNTIDFFGASSIGVATTAILSGGIFTEKHATSHTLTASELYGAVYYVTGAGTLTLPAAAAGMHFSVINENAVSIAVLNTWTSLGVGTASGLYVFRDATSGGMAVFSADSSAGATSIQNGITGFQMRYDLVTGQMQVQVTSGSGTRTIKWVSLLTNLS